MPNEKVAASIWRHAYCFCIVSPQPQTFNPSFLAYNANAAI